MKESCDTIASYDPLQEESLDLALWRAGFEDPTYKFFMHGCRKSQLLSLGSALRVQSIIYIYSTQPTFLIKRSWGHSKPPTIRAIPWDRKGKDFILKD